MKWYLKALKKYAVFGGRASRTEYWMFFLFHLIIAFCVGVVSGILEGPASTDQSVLGSIYQLATIIPSISVGCRRIHDTGRSGWWLIVPIMSLVYLVEEGTKGNNKFGPNPNSQELSQNY